MSQTVLPSYDDPVVAGAVEAVGGPPGAHARLGAARFWTPIRVLLALTVLTCALGWAQKAPCRDGSNWVHEYQYTRACYSDVVALYSAEGLSAGKRPYLDQPVEYPVVIGAVMELAALGADGLTSVFPDRPTSRAAGELSRARTPQQAQAARAARSSAQANAGGRHFYDVTWLLLTVCALVVTVTTARLAARRVWDAALFALAPTLVLHLTTNWDLVATALAAVGLLLWARSRPVLAGILLGLATATKLYPVLFLAPMLMLCLRAGRVRAWGACAGALVFTAVAVTGPVYLISPTFVERSGVQAQLAGSPLSRLSTEGFGALAPHRTVGAETGVNAVYRFFELNTLRGADWDSLTLQATHLHTDHPAAPWEYVGNAWAGLFTDDGLAAGQAPTHLNTAVAVSFLLVLGALGLLALRAPRRPRLPQLLFLTMVGFLLTNKVDSPQYVLWLLPLAVLARPRWRPLLAWQAAEGLVLLTRFAMFVGNDKPGQGLDISWFFAAVLLRDGLLLLYAGLVVRDILRPELDVVRADGSDDPAGGVLDGAPDRGPRDDRVADGGTRDSVHTLRA